MEKEARLVIMVVVAMLILLFTLFLSYRYSQSQPSNLLFPAGATYLGQSPTPPK